jgi:hypothetical protein
MSIEGRITRLEGVLMAMIIRDHESDPRTIEICEAVMERFMTEQKEESKGNVEVTAAMLDLVNAILKEHAMKIEKQRKNN